jgi:tetratricopeptide (TPR) repeat protein
VTGTKFSAGWDRRSDTLTVTMREGSVEVTGPGLKAPARVVGGQRLRANEVTADRPGDPPEVIVEDATTATAAREAADVDAPAEAEPVAPPTAALIAEPAQPEAIEKTTAAPIRDVDRRGARARRAVTAPASTRLALADAEWRGLEAKGKVKEAFAAALREGDWNESCRQLGAADLLKLGNMARNAGQAEHAEVAFRSALRRNPQADRAVYELGRLAFDQRKNYAAAESYFSEYVKRFPTGALVGEAAGLLLESRIKAGHNAGARDAAANYLSRFPNGPHAKLARDTVGH